MIQISYHNKIYKLVKKNNVVLKNEGTYGNGSIDWGARGLFLSDIAQQIGVFQPLAAQIDNIMYPLNSFITNDCTVDFISLDDREGMQMLHRTGRYLLNYAVKQILHDDVQRIGGGIQSAFVIYGDFILQLGEKITAVELLQIQKCLDETVKQNIVINSRKLPYYSTVKELINAGEHHLVRVIEENDDNGPVQVYKMGEYYDLDNGILLSSLEIIKQIKIIHIDDAPTRLRISAEIII